MITTTHPFDEHSSATFSNDMLYRYVLTRHWDQQKPYCMFLMLNPSTADAFKVDPTVNRCINFAKGWGYGGIIVCNIFAFRATDPKDMMACDEPIGADNDKMIIRVAKGAGGIVCAWGNHGTYQNRYQYVERMLKDNGFTPYCLKMTSTKQPGHPLYIKADTALMEYNIHG